MSKAKAPVRKDEKKSSSCCCEEPLCALGPEELATVRELAEIATEFDLAELAVDPCGGIRIVRRQAGGGAAAGSVPPRSASALYFVLLRSPASDSETCFCSSAVDAAGLSGRFARSGVCPLSFATVGESSLNQVVGSTQSGTLGILGKLEQPLALSATANTAATRKMSFFVA